MITFDRGWRWPEPFPWGIWAPFWVRNIDLIRDSIEKFKLKPINAKELPVPGMPAPIAPKEAEKLEYVFKIPTWPGGIRGPHFHYAGEIYMLDSRQWAHFGGVIIDGFKERLEQVNSVTLEQAFEIDESIAGLQH